MTTCVGVEGSGVGARVGRSLRSILTTSGDSQARAIRIGIAINNFKNLIAKV